MCYRSKYWGQSQLCVQICLRAFPLLQWPPRRSKYCLQNYSLNTFFTFSMKSHTQIRKKGKWQTMSVKILMVLLIPNVEDLTNYEWAKNSANEPQWNTAIERGESPIHHSESLFCLCDDAHKQPRPFRTFILTHTSLNLRSDLVMRPPLT